MSNIIRRDPFREMMTLRSAMDRLFDSAFFSPQWEWEKTTSELALDIAENENAYVVQASIPGINPDDLEITFTGKTLTIKGEQKADEERKDVHYHIRERRYGKFARTVTLPAPVEADAIEAKYEAGILTLTLPKSEEARPKRIAVHSAEAPKLIEGKATTIAHKN